MLAPTERPFTAVTPADHVVLVGMMGVGKSTVGRLLATAWSRPFVDADEELERRTGCTVAELFDEHGEPGFRRLETETLEAVLTDAEPAVISCGGGAVIEAVNRALLAEHATVVWLTAPADILALRVGDGRTRPLLGERPGVALEELSAERTPLYETVADHAIDTADRAPATVARLVDEVVG